MPRPFKRRQARENAAFLRLLARTGNARLAARECGLHRATLEKRRRAHASFAAEWEAALAIAQSGLHDAPPPSRSSRAKSKSAATASPPAPEAHPIPRAQGGEPVLVRTRSGALQLRRARPGAIGPACERAFLRALAAGGNLRLAARVAGAAHSSFHARARRDPAFAAEMERAIRIGRDRLESALFERALQARSGEGATSLWMGDEDRGTSACDDQSNPLPPMSVEQALLLLELRQRIEALGSEWGRLATRKRRGAMSSEEIRQERQIWWVKEQREREAEAQRLAQAKARADHYEETGNWFLPGEE